MSKTQIVLSSNPYYYDKKADSYILMDYSLVREDTIYRYKDNYTVVDFLPTAEEYGEIKKYATELSLRYIRSYLRVIESVCGVKLSEDQLNLYWGNWLQGFIADLFNRYKYISEIETNNAYACYNIRNEALRDWRLFGSESGYSSDYHSLIFAKLLSCAGIAVKSVNGKDLYSLKERLVKEAKKSLNRIKRYADTPSKIKSKIENNKVQAELDIPNDYDVLIVQSRMPKSMENMIGEGCNKQLFFVEDVFFRSKMQSLMKNVDTSYEARKMFFNKFRPENDFEKVLDPMVAAFMPRTFFEGLGKLYSEAQIICRGWKYSKIYHSACMEEIFLLCAGIMRARGCLICDIQHSAVYGNVYYFGFAEYSLFDRFCTWGWEPVGIPYSNIRSVAISRIPQKAGRSETPKKDKLLLACNNPELNIGGTGWSYLKYTQRQKEFIDNLSEDCRKQLVIRTDVTKSQSDLEIWCKKKYPYIKFESRFEISFTDSVKESKLLICDYYGSPHIESLMLECPFVFFNAAQLISPNVGLNNVLNKMHDLGLYCDNGVEMATVISEKIHDIPAWMNQEEVKRVLNEYKHEVTRADEDIIKIWCSEFDGN